MEQSKRETVPFQFFLSETSFHYLLNTLVVCLGILIMLLLIYNKKFKSFCFWGVGVGGVLFLFNNIIIFYNPP